MDYLRRALIGLILLALPFVLGAVENVKTITGTARVNIKTINGVAFNSGGGGSSNGLLTNLVAHWDMEEASGTRVDAQGANDLTENGGTIANATGKLGNGADLEESSSQYFQITDPADLSLGAGVSFSVALWYKPESNASGDALIGKNSEYHLMVDMGSTTQIFFQIRGNNNVFHSATLSTGTWYFIVASYNATTGEIAVSVNGGAPETGNEGTNPSDTGNDVFIGQAFDGSQRIDGMIDSMSFWKGRVLNSTDITNLYNSGNGLPFSSFD
jgi:hypothetical protein